MLDLTFGEQVKIVLKRKGMTIKELAEAIETQTGKKMSRQNLTQRLGRDNFQEKDMRMIASILGCPLQLSILEDEPVSEEEAISGEKSASGEEPVSEEKPASKEELGAGEKEEPNEHEITVGEFLDIQKNAKESERETLIRELLADMDAIEREGEERSREREQHQEQRQEKKEQESEKKGGWMSHLRFRRKAEEKKVQEEYLDEDEGVSDIDEGGLIDKDESDEDVSKVENIETEPGVTFEQRKKYEAEREKDKRRIEEPDDEDDEEDLTQGELNPYTGREYASNSVRMHPKRIGYVQVYNRKDHRWTDMTEWAFLGYQERKKMLLGKDYVPPIYLD